MVGRRRSARAEILTADKRGLVSDLKPKADARHELKVVRGFRGSRERKRSKCHTRNIGDYTVDLPATEVNYCVSGVEARHNAL